MARSSGSEELFGVGVGGLLSLEAALVVSSGMILELSSVSGGMAHRRSSASFERAGSKGSTRWKDI